MRDDVDVSGEEFALVVPERESRRIKERRHYRFLGEMRDTVFKLTLRIYYTGNDPGILARPAKSFQFFGWRAGHVVVEPDSDEPTALRER